MSNRERIIIECLQKCGLDIEIINNYILPSIDKLCSNCNKNTLTNNFYCDECKCEFCNHKAEYRINFCSFHYMNEYNYWTTGRGKRIRKF